MTSEVGKAVFLDRDGTIIEDTGYVHKIEEVRFLPGVAQAVKLLNDNGFLVLVVSNQAGVARGYFGEEDVRKVNSYIQDSLARDGAVITGFYYCPHHPEGVIEEYRKDCDHRKPNPGMIKQAAADYEIDLKRSFVIGDKMSDVEAGQRAGCRAILLDDSKVNQDENSVTPDYRTQDLSGAVAWLLQFQQTGDNSR